MTEWHQRERGPITEDKLAKAVHILADIVEKDGAAFRPLYQELRRNLAEFRLQKQADAAMAAIEMQAAAKVA